jgi:hypothetical protein
MAVEQSQAGIIGGEVHLDLLIAAHHDYIFHDSGGEFAGELGQLKTVPMK